MAQVNLYFVLLTILHLSVLDVTLGQNVTAGFCQARLPSARDRISAAYDGNDSIFIFGGYDGRNNLKDVLRYSISEDKIEPVAELLEGSVSGAAVIDKSGRIFSLHGASVSNPSKSIFQLFPETGSFRKVGELPTQDSSFAVVSPDPDTLIYFGGDGSDNRIYEINMTSFEPRQIGNLPSPRYYSTAFWAEELGMAYVFPSHIPAFLPITNIVKYNHARRELAQLDNHFPFIWYPITALWDGRHGYIIGGLEGAPSNGAIQQFDPVTENVRNIEVGGPDSWTQHQVAFHAAVYVQKLNRIYIIGGWWSPPSVARDEIYYIDLDPIDPSP